MCFWLVLFFTFLLLSSILIFFSTKKIRLGLYTLRLKQRLQHTTHTGQLSECSDHRGLNIYHFPFRPIIYNTYGYSISFLIPIKLSTSNIFFSWAFILSDYFFRTFFVENSYFVHIHGRSVLWKRIKFDETEPFHYCYIKNIHACVLVTNDWLLFFFFCSNHLISSSDELERFVCETFFSLR